MHKTTTILNKTDKSNKALKASISKMQPSDKVLKTILQFSSVYSVEQFGSSQYIETILN